MTNDAIRRTVLEHDARAQANLTRRTDALRRWAIAYAGVAASASDADCYGAMLHSAEPVHAIIAKDWAAALDVAVAISDLRRALGPAIAEVA